MNRGLFRSTSLKKYFATIQKNQSTSQNDQFMKPDPTKVKDMKPGSYEKLNDDGIAPEETFIVNGDIIIGKVSPIQPSGTNSKSFKDNSEVYKSHIPGVIDKVYSDIYNHEGYEMKKMRVRSERTPHIGDKVCSRHGQKGTVGITLPNADMPFTAKGITPDLIMNPNAIPSRMTIGQFVECITGKIAAIKGHEIDGTPFNEIDISQIKAELEGLGYKDDGTEELYNGMTGKKMKVRIFIGPTFYMRLKHMVSDKMHCLTMDHEVKTRAGWKTYNELTMNDEIATLKDGMLVYDKPLDLLYYPNFEGDLYHVKSSELDLKVTTNHRMYVSKNGVHFDLVEANKIMGEYVYYKTGLQTLTNIYTDVNSAYSTVTEQVTHSKEPVFCLTVPSEVFYVRRNGKPVWTGNSRSRGPRTLLTRQAPEGRSRDGGLRVGEMERDTILSHGMSKFLKERMLETADIYTTWVCDECGLFAQRMLKKDQTIYPSKKDIYWCPACRNKTNVSKIMIPYAFKLLLQELMSMSIAPRIRVKKNKFNEF